MPNLSALNLFPAPLGLALDAELRGLEPDAESLDLGLDAEPLGLGLDAEPLGLVLDAALRGLDPDTEPLDLGLVALEALLCSQTFPVSAATLDMKCMAKRSACRK